MNDIGIVTDVVSRRGFELGPLTCILSSLSLFFSLNVKDDDAPSDSGFLAVATALNRRVWEESPRRMRGFLIEFRVFFITAEAIAESERALYRVWTFDFCTGPVQNSFSQVLFGPRPIFNI